MQLLEFDRISKRLQNFTLTVPGREKAVALDPSSQFEEVQKLQKETSEAVFVLLNDLIGFASCPHDLSPSLQRAAKDGTLTAVELAAICDFLKKAASLQVVFLRQDLIAQKAPLLTSLISELLPLPQVVSRLDRCLDQQGEIRDDASPLLLSLHREEKVLQEKVRSTLEGIRRSQTTQKYLQENIVTMRQGRYVLPVKHQYRQQIPGIMHDQSASGQTLFIEPFPVMELNNRLLGVQSRIEKEKERILRELSYLIQEYEETISFNYELYGRIDLILARGKLSLEYEGNEPELNDRGVIRIRGGRHPFLAPGEAVPVDLYLGEDFNVLIITGPNTGGKTVTLKMAGTFVLMSQCGLHLPARPGSEISLFDNLWADIGDEQNISQSLSTFSGHMKNIIEIIRYASQRSLVLLDELGAGTDPSEGSALAMAVLEELHQRGARTVATTHINELKVFAHMREGMENASMEFDAETLQPTFRLLIGVPGQSNAISVAARLGMPEEVLEKAGSYIRKELLNMDEVVSDLLAERQKLTRETEKVDELKQELTNRLDEVTGELSALEQRRKEVLARAKQDAGELLRTTKRKTDEVIKKLYAAEREENKQKGLSQAEEARREAGQILRNGEGAEVSWSRGKDVELEKISLEQLKEGVPVFVKSLGTAGKVQRVVSVDEIQVAVGSLKVWTNLDDLGREKKEGAAQKSTLSKREKKTDQTLMWEKTAAVQPELDLRGLTLEEAILKVDKYLDDAILAGLDKVVIIHGKGSGKLRQGLHRYFQGKGNIKSFRPGGEGEGGSGVTVVELKH